MLSRQSRTGRRRVKFYLSPVRRSMLRRDLHNRSDNGILVSPWDARSRGMIRREKEEEEYSWSGWLLCLKEYWREEQNVYSLIEITLVSCSFSQSLLCCKLAWFVIYNFNVNATISLHPCLLLSVRLVGGRIRFISSSTYYSNRISKSIVYTLNCL